MTTLMEKAVFSIYGVSIEHPMDWKTFFDPKRGCSRSTGFFRIEDFVPQKGAQLSLSLNWEKATSDNESFAHQYAEHIAQEYQKQMKKTPYQIERMEVIDFQGGKAAYIVSEYRGSPGLVKRKTDGSVRTIQLAFYDDPSQRAVVSTLIGRPERVSEEEDLLRELVFSVRCGRLETEDG